jgi:hypothetical protein
MKPLLPVNRTFMRPTTMKSQAPNASNGNYVLERRFALLVVAARSPGLDVAVHLFLGGEPVVELLA